MGDFILTSKNLVDLLFLKNLKISTCESCTGGLVSKKITEIPGSSEVFEFGCVTYANKFKNLVANVSKETLEKFGAVSEECAFEMAKGIKEFSKSDIGISITGIAGPGGGTEEKPVGLVYICVFSERGFKVEKNLFGSDLSREEIRSLSAEHALKLAAEHIEKYY